MYVCPFVYLPSVDFVCMVINGGDTVVCWVRLWVTVVIVEVDSTFRVVAIWVEGFVYIVDCWEDVKENIGEVLKVVIFNVVIDTVIFPVISSVVILLVVFRCSSTVDSVDVVVLMAG